MALPTSVTTAPAVGSLFYLRARNLYGGIPGNFPSGVNPDPTRVVAAPMTLREIFMVLARQGRQPREAVA